MYVCIYLYINKLANCVMNMELSQVTPTKPYQYLSSLMLLSFLHHSGEIYPLPALLTNHQSFH